MLVAWLDASVLPKRGNRAQRYGILDGCMIGRIANFKRLPTADEAVVNITYGTVLKIF